MRNRTHFYDFHQTHCREENVRCALFDIAERVSKLTCNRFVRACIYLVYSYQEFSHNDMVKQSVDKEVIKLAYTCSNAMKILKGSFVSLGFQKFNTNVLSKNIF